MGSWYKDGESSSLHSLGGLFLAGHVRLLLLSSAILQPTLANSFAEPEAASYLLWRSLCPVSSRLTTDAIADWIQILF